MAAIVPSFNYLRIDRESSGEIRVKYAVSSSNIKYSSIIKSQILKDTMEYIYKILFAYYDDIANPGGKKSTARIASLLIKPTSCTISFIRKTSVSGVTTKIREKSKPFTDVNYSTISPGGQLKAKIDEVIILVNKAATA